MYNIGVISWFQAFRGTSTDPHDVLATEEAEYVLDLFSNNGIVRCKRCERWCTGDVCDECVDEAGQ